MKSRVLENFKNFRYGFQNQEEDPELWGGDIAFKYRVEDPRLGRFFSIDPLTRKFPSNSTYAFSENRVCDGIELEGMEVVLFDPNDRPWFYNSGIKDKKSSPQIIDIYAHGWSAGIVDDSKGIANREQLKTPAQFDKLLQQKEEKWRNRKNGTVMVIVLHACETGKTTIDEKGNTVPPVAQTLSASKEFKDVYIIAPNTGDNYGQQGEKGPVKDKDGKPGKWVIFLNGKQVGSVNKDAIPKLKKVLK